MALRMAALKSAGESVCCRLGFKRWAYVAAQPPLLDRIMSPIAVPQAMILPEVERSLENSLRTEQPRLYFGGSMELMAVPKKKDKHVASCEATLFVKHHVSKSKAGIEVSRHKRGIRNGPKALKPVPVIVRCRVCGRVKLPHFFCCSGIKNTE